MSVEEDRIKTLLHSIDKSWRSVSGALENGLFELREGADSRPIFQKLGHARACLLGHPQNFTLAERLYDEAAREFYRIRNAKGKGMRKWRLLNTYALHVWSIMIGYLVVIFIAYSAFLYCPSEGGLCYIRASLPAVAILPGESLEQSQDVTLGLGIGNNQDNDSSDTERQADPVQGISYYEALAFPVTGVYAVLWGAVGSILQGLYILWRHISELAYRKPWIVYYISMPFVGGILGAIAYFLLSVGLITVAQTETQVAAERFTLLVIVVAGYAGFKWQSAVAWFERVGGLIRSGDQEKGS